MSVIKDLESFDTWDVPDDELRLRFAVGWLGTDDFPREEPSEEFLDALFAACQENVRKQRGFHVCPFCELTEEEMYDMPSASRNSHTLHMGFAEIDITGEDGRVYAAPNLIYHYVETHHYDPPREFVEAVIRQCGMP